MESKRKRIIWESIENWASQRLISNVTYLFVKGYPSRKQTVHSFLCFAQVLEFPVWSPVSFWPWYFSILFCIRTEICWGEPLCHRGNCFAWIIFRVGTYTLPELSRFGALNYLRTCFIECIQCSLNLSSSWKYNTIKRVWGRASSRLWKRLLFCPHNGQLLFPA